MDNVKIVLHIEDIDTDIAVPTPSCLIFYIIDDNLYHLKVLVSASLLKSVNEYTVYSFLERNYEYMISLLIDNKERTTYNFIENFFSNNEILRKSKLELIKILRLQKIELLFSE